MQKIVLLIKLLLMELKKKKRFNVDLNSDWTLWCLLYVFLLSWIVFFISNLL